METQRITNTISNIHGYLNDPITYQWSTDWPLEYIYCSDSLAENWGGFLSFGRIVGEHKALWIDINWNRLLGFRKHNIIPPTARNLFLTDTRRIKIFNDTLHRTFVKHEIYQKIHYIHVRASNLLPTHLAQAFEKLDELITRLMHAEDKNSEGK